MPENEPIFMQRSWWMLHLPPVIATAVGIAMFAAMFALRNFGTYTAAVLSHWVSLMSGGVSVIVSFYVRIRKRSGSYLFYGVAAMCVFFAGFQAWQDQYDKASVKPSANLQIFKFEQSRNPDPLPLGKQIALNMYYLNMGNSDADNLVAGGKIFVLPDDSIETQKSALAQFKQWWDSVKKDKHSLRQGALDQQFSTALGPILTSPDKDALNRGALYIYALYSIEYDDPTGSHFQHVCRYLQPPPFAPVVYHFCDPSVGFNDHK